MTTAKAPIQGIKALSYPPQRGEHWLSINLALVDDVAATFAIAQELGFKPELAQVSTRFSVEIHALLLHEQLSGSPLHTTDLDDKIDQLADRINTAAICHTYGGQMVA